VLKICIYVLKIDTHNKNNHTVYHSLNLYTMQRNRGKLHSMHSERCGMMTYHLLVERGMDREEECE